MTTGQVIAGALVVLALAAIWWRERRWSREHPGQCHICGAPTEHYMCDDCHEGVWW